MSTVIYVHGNGNKPPQDALKDQWDRSLFGENVGDRSRMAYWASVRYPTPLPSLRFDEADPGPGTAAAEADEAAAEVDPPGLATETLQEAGRISGPAGLAGPSPEAGALEPWLLRMAYAADAIVAGEDLDPPAPIPAALPLPRPARVAAFRALVKVTFKDVYAYFFGGFAEPMRAVLRQELRAVQGDVVVVSHSLGTILAYDVLREPAFAHRNIPLLLTAGSPLAVTEVQDLVVRPLQVPAGVVRWWNVADTRDVVALDGTIRPEYAPAERCRDVVVTNDSDNHHGIRQYLSSRAVQDAVRAVF